jgi:hypothetical protein
METNENGFTNKGHKEKDRLNKSYEKENKNLTRKESSE